MLLLAIKLRSSLTAVALTWINKLDEPGFPTSYEIKPYTDEEIKERQLKAEFQVDYFTNGLLEIVTDNKPRLKEGIFFSKQVQFFHRTVHDFVAQSKQLRNFSAKFPYYTSNEMAARILISELWFVDTKYARRPTMLFDLFANSNWENATESRHTWLDAHEKVISHHHNVGSTQLWGMITFPFWENSASSNGTTMSHLHWVADMGDWDYVRSKLMKKPDLLHAKDSLSLILTAAVSWPVSPVLKGVLDFGASPNERVNIDHQEYHSSASVWMIFCTYFAACMVEHQWRDVPKYCSRLECFLATEAVDANVLILLAPEGPHVTPHATHAITLGELVRQLKPENWDALSKLLSPSKGVMAYLRGAWRYLVTKAPPRSEQSHQPDKYLPFSLDTPVLALDGSNRENTYGRYGFYVHSVILGNAKVLARRLKIRNY